MSLQGEVLQAQSSSARPSALHVPRKTLKHPPDLVMDAGRGRQAAIKASDSRTSPAP